MDIGPDSGVRTGFNEANIGSHSMVRSGIEYVPSRKPTPLASSDTPIIPPDVDPQPAPDNLWLYESIIQLTDQLTLVHERLDQQLRLLSYLSLPWYTRLRLWVKDHLHV